jgi:predicted AAA+ superfamily ATPase
MTWYKELGFRDNPFTIKPQRFFDDFFGHDDTVDNILESVDEGKFLIVSGSFGTGKTSIMKSIIDEYKGERKVFYYNAYSSERKIDYNDVLVKGGSFFSRLFGIKSKDMILLIDEAHNLMEHNIDEVIDYYNDGYFRSVILVTSKPDFKFSKDIEKIIDGNRYILTMFSLKDALKLVENRLEDMVDLIPKKIIEKIYKSSSTPREFLMKCEDAARRAVERGSEIIEEEDLR